MKYLAALYLCVGLEIGAAVKELRLGNHHFKVATKSAAAQKAFDRGLTLAYSFAHFAAEEEFRAAVAADPELAMGWWGIALVNGPHINFPMVPPDRAKKAWEAMEKARQHAGKSSSLERALIGALEKRYAWPQPEDRSPLDQAYAEAMRAVWRKYPAHSDVGALFAESMMDLRPWDLWQADGNPQPGTPEIVETLERTLWLKSRHPGANHYYIHTMEASLQPKKAERAADRLRKLVPDSGHMVHMPAHIYARLGRWDDAAKANLLAMEADQLYRAKYPRPGFYGMYMAHNSHFYGWVAMMQGRSADAVAHARKMVAEVPEDFIRDYGPVVDGYLAFVPEVLMRFGKWEEILQEPKPPGELPLSQALWRYARATALTALNRWPEARKERELFLGLSVKIPADATFGNNPASRLVSIGMFALAGEMAAKEGKFTEAESNLRTAIGIQDQLRYNEPPDWIQPVRHTLGEVLMRSGKVAEAETVYREDLQQHPENGWALYGLGQALRAQGRTFEAKRVEGRFKKAWREADISLTSTCLCLR